MALKDLLTKATGATPPKSSAAPAAKGLSGLLERVQIPTPRPDPTVSKPVEVLPLSTDYGIENSTPQTQIGPVKSFSETLADITNVLKATPKYALDVITAVPKAILDSELHPSQDELNIEKNFDISNEHGVQKALDYLPSVLSKGVFRFFQPVFQPYADDLSQAIASQDPTVKHDLDTGAITSSTYEKMFPALSKSNLQLLGDSTQAGLAIFMPGVFGKSVGAFSDKPLLGALTTGFRNGAVAGGLFGTAQVFSSGSTDPAQIADIYAKNIIGGGLISAISHGAVPMSKDAFTLATKKIEKQFGMPEHVYINPEQVKDIFQTGKLTNDQQKELINSLGLDGAGYKKAFDEGLSIEIPSENIVSITDRPYWAAIKDSFGFKATNEVIRADTAPRVSERILNPSRQLPSANEIRAKIAGGKTPSEVALELSHTVDAASAVKLVDEVVKNSPEIKPQEVEIAPKETAPVAVAHETATPLADKVGNEILTKTPMQIQDDFTSNENAHQQETGSLRVRVANLERTVRDAAPGSQAKKEAKIQLAASKTELETAVKGNVERYTTNAASFRQYFTKHFKAAAPKLSDEQVSSMVSEMTDRIVNPEKIGLHHSKTLESMAKEILTEQKNVKITIPKKEVDNKVVEPKQQEKTPQNKAKKEKAGKVPQENVEKLPKPAKKGPTVSDLEGKSIKDLHTSLKTEYRKLGVLADDGDKMKADQELDHIFVEMFDLSEKGYRFVDESTGEVKGVESTFPKWLPEDVRSKALFEKVFRPISSIEELKYPAARNVRQIALYDAVLDTLDSRLGIDTSAIRNKIKESYGKETHAGEIEDASDSGATGGEEYPEAKVEEVENFGREIARFRLKDDPAAFDGFTDLSTAILETLKGRTTVSKQFISDLTNSGDLKQSERDVIREVLKGEPDTVNVKDFADRVKAQLLPLKRNSTGDYEIEPGIMAQGQFENTTLEDGLRGPVAEYREHVYESPIPTDAGGRHFGKKEYPNYFAHSRTEDMIDTTVDGSKMRGTEYAAGPRRVIEIQSDLFQKGGLENESPRVSQQANKKWGVFDRRTSDLIGPQFKTKEEAEAFAKDRTAKLEAYRNTWQDRIIKEEVKRAAQDGKPSVLFPTGETALKIEGLAQNNRWFENPNGEEISFGSKLKELTPENLKVGMQVGSDAHGDTWIVTDVLGDGKFKAVSQLSADNDYPIYQAAEKIGALEKDGSGVDLKKFLANPHGQGVLNNSQLAESFDISGKADANNPIFKFYEKEVGRYLKNRYGAVPFTDERGVTWNRVDIQPGMAEKPILAFKGRISKAINDFVSPEERDLTGQPEATAYLDSVKDRLKIDFDVHFVDNILSGYKVNPILKTKTPLEAWGVTYDNSIGLVKEMAKHTAGHEVVHLTLANLDKIPVFKASGLTRDALMDAQAAKMGVKRNASNEGKIEEAMAMGFEDYANEKGPAPTGILRRFFQWLKVQLMRFARALIQTKGDIVRDFYDIIDEGRSISTEITKLESRGVMESFLDGEQSDVIDTERMESMSESKFKLKGDEDTHLGKLKKEYNDLADTTDALEQNRLDWKKDLEKEIIVQSQKAEDLAATSPAVKYLNRFTKKNKPPVQFTERGEQQAQALGFEDPQAAQEEIAAYLQRKTEIVEVRNRMRELRRDIAAFKGTEKETAAAMRDVERKLRLRKHLLEQKDFYIGMGQKRGNKEAMRMIAQRGRVVNDLGNLFGIGDKRTKDIIANRRLHLMSEHEFDDFLAEFYNRASDLGNKLSAIAEAKSVIAEKQLSKWENLQKAMGLPSVDKMTEEQATRFADALSKYQFGDTFITQRMIETVHRTNWGDVKTEREVLDKVQQFMGVSKEDLKNVTSPENGGKFTPWLKLARQNPMYGWLISKRIEADIQATREHFEIDEQLQKLARASRASRRQQMTAGDKAKELIAPTDDMVFDYIEAKDKPKFAKENSMTPQELAFADYYIMQARNAYEYLSGEYGMAHRDNYMTHARRSFMEAFKDDGAMAAIREVFRSQQEQAAAMKILDDKTGETIAFEKFFGNMLRRSGDLVPSKNVARVASEYFRAVATKRALDSFIPEAMIAVQAHKALTGKTPKGLDKDPTFEQFVKKFLNNAKGRRIDFVTKQGEKADMMIRTYTGWLAFKYLGFNMASAVGNLVGDFTSIFWELKAREIATGVARSIAHPIQAHEVNKAYRYFTGKNPFVEIFDPKHSIPAQVKTAAMALMNVASFQSNKFFLRSLMTPEEFASGVISDPRLTEIAKQLSRVKPNKFYVKSLAGSTTVGGAAFQMGGWAITIFNTIVSDAQEVIKIGKDHEKGGYKKAFTSEEAGKLYKFIVMAGVAALVASFINVDDSDNSFRGRTIRSMKQNLQTLFQGIQFAVNPASYFLVAQDAVKLYTFASQVLTQEKYTSDGMGYKQGDPKWINSGEKIITPSLVKQFFPQQNESALESKVAAGEPTAAIVKDLYSEEIAKQEKDNGAEAAADYTKKKIGEVDALKHARATYPDSKVLSIAMGDVPGVDTEKQKVEALVELSKETSVAAVTTGLFKLYSDKGLCSDPTGGTGCYVSSKLIKAWQIAKK